MTLEKFTATCDKEERERERIKYELTNVNIHNKTSIPIYFIAEPVSFISVLRLTRPCLVRQ